MSAVRKTRPEENSAIYRAIHAAGGIQALANTTGFSDSAVKRWLAAGEVDSPSAAATLEEATKVPAEDLMPRAYWLRAADGELLGIATPINGADVDYMRSRLGEAQEFIGELIDGKYDAVSYIAGMTRKLSEEKRNSMMPEYIGRHDDNGGWTDDILDDLLDNANEATIATAGHSFFGMCYELSDDDRSKLYDKHRISDHRLLSIDLAEAVMADINRIRASKTPGLYDIESAHESEWAAVLIDISGRSSIPVDRLKAISSSTESLGDVITYGLKALADLMVVATGPRVVNDLQDRTISWSSFLIRSLTDLLTYIRVLESNADCQIRYRPNGVK